MLFLLSVVHIGIVVSEEKIEMRKVNRRVIDATRRQKEKRQCPYKTFVPDTLSANRYVNVEHETYIPCT